MDKGKLKIIDVTIKEGGFLVNHHFLADQVADIARELQRAGVEYTEISHGHGIGTLKRGGTGLHNDEEILQAAKEAAPELKLCVFISSKSAWLEDIERVAPWIDCGRVGTNIDQLYQSQKQIEKLKKLGKTAISQLMRVHAFSPEEVAETAAEVSKMGAEVIYLTDTYGSMGPEDVKKYIHAVKSRIDLPLGFQSRNHTGRSIHNTLVAFEEGAEWLDGSINGMGKGGGVTQLEVLAYHLQTKGLCKNFDLIELSHTAKNFVLPAIRRSPFINYVSLLTAKYKIDFSQDILVEQIANILQVDPEEIFLRIKKSNPKAIQATDENLKQILSEEGLDLDVVMEFIKSGKIPHFS